VATTTNLVIDFSEAVDAETGNIVIRKSSDDSIVETIAVGSAQVTGSGTDIITINPSVTLDYNTSYYVQIDATAFDDALSNSFAGISNTTTWNFTTAADAVPPSVSITSPSNGASVSGTINLTASASDDAGVAGVQFKRNTNTLIGSEDTGSPYSVSWDTTGVSDGSHTIIAVARDAAGNYATSSSITITVDNTAPTVESLSPADNATDIARASDLVITFDEAVDVETGNILIKKTSDDSTVHTIDVTSGLVTGTGTDTITINPSSNLDYNTSYYVQIDATAFDDTSGNSFAGISNTTTWNFTTIADNDVPVRSNASPSGTLSSGTQNVTLSVTTDEAATCRYSGEAGTSYSSMTSAFSITGGTTHTQNLSGLAPGTYTYYARCIDGSLNENTDDFTISFTVPVPTSTGRSGGGGGGGGRSTPTVAPVAQDNQAIITLLITQLNLLRAQLAVLTGTAYVPLPTPTGAVAPGVPSTQPLFSRYFGQGASGADVTRLQEILVSRGYLVMPASVAYGYFGPLTYTALVKFQADNNVLPATGYFGPASTALLKSLGY
jgi:hypothetical protein